MNLARQLEGTDDTNPHISGGLVTRFSNFGPPQVKMLFVLVHCCRVNLKIRSLLSWTKQIAQPYVTLIQSSKALMKAVHLFSSYVIVTILSHLRTLLVNDVKTSNRFLFGEL